MKAGNGTSAKNLLLIPQMRRNSKIDQYILYTQSHYCLFREFVLLLFSRPGRGLCHEKQSGPSCYTLSQVTKMSRVTGDKDIPCHTGNKVIPGHNNNKALRRAF